jgi:hypothetical protein
MADFLQIGEAVEAKLKRWHPAIVISHGGSFTYVVRLHKDPGLEIAGMAFEHPWGKRYDTLRRRENPVRDETPESSI